jgi:hypothetical protein
MIKLAFGKEVTLDEFLTWSAMKQNKNLQGKDSTWYKNLMATMNTPESKAKRLVAAKKRADAWRGTKKPHLANGWYHAPADKKEQAKQKLRELNAKQFATPESRISRRQAGKQQFATDESKQQQRENRSRPMMTPLGEFPGKWAVAEAMGTTPHEINKLMIKYPKQYYYLIGERGKPIVTPQGMFVSNHAAATHYKVGGDTIRRWIKKLPDQFYLISIQDYIAKVGPKKVGIQNRAEILSKAKKRQIQE